MPLDVADFVREVIDIPAATMVMSATLAGQPMKDLGVPQSRLIDAGTPFDFATQRLGLVANYSAKGNEEQRIRDMVSIVRKVVGEGGGAIVVSKTSSRQIGGRWVSQIEEAQDALERAGFSVGIQNDTSDIPRLVAELTDGTIDVIIGKRAVGEGIDIKGPRLSAVIFLDRPWPYMGDPVLKARARMSGDKWALPSALMKVNLEQGIGRLIRTVTDEGIVVMLDGSAARDFAEAMQPSKVVRLGVSR
jgi:ATP-dependent DNA helicase DinG